MYVSVSLCPLRTVGLGVLRILKQDSVFLCLRVLGGVIKVIPVMVKVFYNVCCVLLTSVLANIVDLCLGA